MADYPFTRQQTGPNWDVVVPKLMTEIQSALGLSCSVSAGAPTPDAVIVTFENALDAGQEALLNATVAAHKASDDALDAARAVRFAQVDERTRELIAQGFEYPAASGQIFSLSKEAQIRLETVDRVRDTGEILYPIAWNTIDDMDVIDLQDAIEVHGMWLAAVAQLRTWVDSGSALKAALRAATDFAQLDAVVDNR